MSIIVELPDESLPSPADSPDDFATEARFLLALKLFELGRVSSGKAARICGMGRVEFLFAAGRYGVPVADLDDEDLIREFAPDA
jgi:predicted HTH domain antitoxin